MVAHCLLVDCFLTQRPTTLLPMVFTCLGLKEYQQSYFVGIRNTFWRVAVIAAQGGLVYLSGIFAGEEENYTKAWGLVFGIAAIGYLLIALYHKFILPKPETDPEKNLQNIEEVFISFYEIIKDFFKRNHIVVFLLFVLFYRLERSSVNQIGNTFFNRHQGSRWLGIK